MCGRGIAPQFRPCRDAALQAGGKWKTYEITAKGRQVTVMLSGLEDGGVAQRKSRSVSNRSADRGQADVPTVPAK